MRSNNRIHNKVVYSFASAEAILATGGFLRLEEEYWFRVVFVTTRGLFVSCCFLRLEEEYWFRAVFCYDSKRSIGFVWFF